MSDQQWTWRKPRLFPGPSEDAVDYIGRVHGIDVIEYPQRAPSRALLICAGTGLMLSLMDVCPRLRWCVDADGLSRSQLLHLSEWMHCVNNVTDLIVVAGWYCSTNPLPLSGAVRRLNGERVLCYVQCRGVGNDPFNGLRSAHSLDDLIELTNSFPDLPWPNAPRQQQLSRG